ncbi:MAG: hypothetical protein EPN40_09395 [Rhodanobacteraceae bacterium]|nr:MAG: hypothetical protein EPN40_09395 [Rhodanobacteraceae bacterium]
MTPTNTKPRGGSRGAGFERKGSREYIDRVRQLYGARRAGDHPAGYLPRDWRRRLPDPAKYYAQHVDRLGNPNASGWAQGLCPFHDDHHPSLSVHVADGGAYRCMSCGASGRDVLAFHMARTGYGFKQAVRDLLGLGVRA